GRAAVLPQAFDRLLGRHRLNEEEEARGAGLDHGANARRELRVDAGLCDLGKDRAEARADRDTADWDEEDDPEEKAPEHAPSGASRDRMMVGRNLILALAAADDHS